MYRKQRPCKGGKPPCMGGVHGRGGGDPSSDRDERNLSETERNHRTGLCRRKRKTWNEIYTVQRIGKSDNGADPFICMYESKETGNLEMEKGWAKEPLFFCLDIRTNISIYKIQNGSWCDAPGTILSTV